MEQPTDTEWGDAGFIVEDRPAITTLSGEVIGGIDPIVYFSEPED